MAIKRLNKPDVTASPYLIWNAYVELLALNRYENLTPEQRPAHLMFWYESEVQNGGHLQYFENLGTERLSETIAALDLLGAVGQRDVLNSAGKLWCSQPRVAANTEQQFIAKAIEGEFTLIDSRFHRCSPSLEECLKTHLQENQATFVAIV